MTEDTYTYTGGWLELQAKMAEPIESTYHGHHLQYKYDLRIYQADQKRIEESRILAPVELWGTEKREGLIKGKDFILQWQVRDSNDFTVWVSHDTEPRLIGASYMKRQIAIPTQQPTAAEETFIPPDNGDVCWTVGAALFTRKEVAYLLYTQRAMISNDLKAYCGNTLTKAAFDILANPRTPNF